MDKDNAIEVKNITKEDLLKEKYKRIREIFNE